MRQKEICILVLLCCTVFLWCIGVTSALGQLDTARIGVTQNLDIDGEILTKILKVSNPSDQVLNVEVQDLNFKEINSGNPVLLVLSIFPHDFTMQPNSTQDIEVVFKIEEPGQYEGKINFLFTPEESKQSSSLNSVIQINAIPDESLLFPKTLFWILGTILIVILGVWLTNKIFGNR